MGKILFIGAGQKRDENEVGDYVRSTNSELGPGYASFDIIDVPGVDALILDARMKARFPETRTIYKSALVPDEWGDSEPEMRKTWNDSGTWKFFDAKPKHRVNIRLTARVRSDLSDSGIDGATRLAILDKASHNIKRNPENEILVPGYTR